MPGSRSGRSPTPALCPGPLYLPEYRLRRRAARRRSTLRPTRSTGRGTEAKKHDDRYVLSTVFFAAVLFFAGMSLRVLWQPLRLTVLVLASVMLSGRPVRGGVAARRVALAACH